MKIKFVYGIFPALIFYTDWINDQFAGVGNAMIVRIRPQHKDDEGLLQHELTHVRQSYRWLIIFHAWLYLLSDNYRLHAEVEAYRKQLEYSKDKDMDVVLFVGFVCTKYKLQVDPLTVENLLREV